MCLRTVIKIYAEPDKEIWRGWKAFRQDHSGTLYFPYWPPSGDSDDKNNATVIGMWLHSSTGETETDQRPYETYPLGFHIFQTKEAATNWAADHIYRNNVIREVEATDVVAEGTQRDGAVFVARKMRIL